MLNIDLEFRKGILFIRLDGKLIKTTVNKFNEEVNNMIKINGIRNAVINVSELNEIDLKGINSLYYSYEICRNNKGRLIMCGLNNLNIVKKIRKSHLLNYTRETNSELDVFNIIAV